jgi:hypothetical protein
MRPCSATRLTTCPADARNTQRRPPPHWPDEGQTLMGGWPQRRKRNIVPGQPGFRPALRAGLAQSCHQPFSARRPDPERRTAPRPAALRYFTAVRGRESSGSNVRNMASDLRGAMGIRTPDLLHAISRQHVHRSPSLQVTVPTGAWRSAPIRGRCGTFLLYSPGGPQESRDVAVLPAVPFQDPSARPAK